MQIASSKGKIDAKQTDEKNDDDNPPHIHIRYSEYRGMMEIETLNLISGYVPAKIRGLVEEWCELHKNELLQMWKSKDFHKIKPLV